MIFKKKLLKIIKYMGLWFGGKGDGIDDAVDFKSIELSIKNSGLASSTFHFPPLLDAKIKDLLNKTRWEKFGEFDLSIDAGKSYWALAILVDVADIGAGDVVVELVVGILVLIFTDVFRLLMLLPLSQLFRRGMLCLWLGGFCW